MKRIRRYFFHGLLVVAPVAVTAYVFYRLFILIDRPVGALVERVFGGSVPGAGFLATAVLAFGILTLVGFLSGNLLMRSLGEYFERRMERLPLVKLIHSSIRDLLEAFVGEKKRFDQPVAVALAPDGVEVLGFLARRDMGPWGLAERVAVYLPQSYNFAGNVVIVPCDRVRPLSVASGEVMTFIVSGGISGGPLPPG